MENEENIRKIKGTPENIIKELEDIMQKAYKIVLKIGNTVIAMDYGLNKTEIARVGDIIMLNNEQKEIVINFKASELQYVEFEDYKDKIYFFEGD